MSLKNKNVFSALFVSGSVIGFLVLLAALIVYRSDADYTNTTTALQIASESGFVQVSPRNEVILYTVTRRDTLEEISQKFAVSVDTIRWENNLSDASLAVGQTLRIPPVTGVVHRVVKGDTLSVVSERYHTDPQKIVNFPGNQFADQQYRLIPGGYLIVPDGSM